MEGEEAGVDGEGRLYRIEEEGEQLVKIGVEAEWGGMRGSGVDTGCAVIVKSKGGEE